RSETLNRVEPTHPFACDFRIHYVGKFVRKEQPTSKKICACPRARVLENAKRLGPRSGQIPHQRSNQSARNSSHSGKPREHPEAPPPAGYIRETRIASKQFITTEAGKRHLQTGFFGSLRNEPGIYPIN